MREIRVEALGIVSLPDLPDAPLGLPDRDLTVTYPDDHLAEIDREVEQLLAAQQKIARVPRGHFHLVGLSAQANNIVRQNDF